MRPPCPGALAAALAVALAGACAPSEAGPGALRIRASPTPPTVGGSRIIVQLPPGAGEATSVTVRGRPLEGPAGPPLQAHASGPGAWAVADFPFERTGDWRLVAEAVLASGELLRDSVDMRVVGDG